MLNGHSLKRSVGLRNHTPRPSADPILSLAENRPQRIRAAIARWRKRPSTESQVPQQCAAKAGLGTESDELRGKQVALQSKREFLRQVLHISVSHSFATTRTCLPAGSASSPVMASKTSPTSTDLMQSFLNLIQRSSPQPSHGT